MAIKDGEVSAYPEFYAHNQLLFNADFNDSVPQGVYRCQQTTAYFTFGRIERAGGTV